MPPSGSVQCARMLKNTDIDNGRSFDWGRVSRDYAEYRDIYPPEFYRRILDAGICAKGKRVLDIGTGTGVLPRNLYGSGAEFVGVDSSERQIAEAKLLSEKAGMNIPFQCVPAEKIDFPDSSFDAVTACQCLVYFNHAELAPALRRVLKPGGRFAVLYMAWLPFEDRVAGESEGLILKYNPMWTGGGEKRRPIRVPEAYGECFRIESQTVFDLQVAFSRESWNGRIKSCRGVGASLSEREIADFDSEHRKLLNGIAPPEFNVLHYAAITVLGRK